MKERRGNGVPAQNHFVIVKNPIPCLMMSGAMKKSWRNGMN